jgi:hypothetical protein
MASAAPSATWTCSNDEDEELAVGDVDREVVDGDGAVEALGHPAQRDGVRHEGGWEHNIDNIVKTFTLFRRWSSSV